jgi:signal transduction histidine kinase
MRLTQFISTHREAILEAWDQFADTLQPETRAIPAKELRDHAAEMLAEIVADISTPQSAQQSVEKSHGDGLKTIADTASEVHAAIRLRSGFSIDQLVAEYRALRASVLLLWSQQPDRDVDFREQDTLRFNEAIDKGLAESVARYSRSVSESQDIFLGMLGHDLRTPLSVVLLSAEFFLQADVLDASFSKIAAGIYTSGRRAQKIVESLLDFARARAGDGISLDRIKGDLTEICEGIVSEVCVLHPDRAVVFEPKDRIVGHFDTSRMGQVFSNLIENAITHGKATSPVTVSQQLESNHAVFSFHNEGEPIAAEDQAQIFDPMRRHSQFASGELGPRAGLGLGLYIVKEIISAHGGTIEVTSSTANGTTFCVRLPLAL